jgi:MazG family protein
VDDVLTNWEAIKRAERATKAANDSPSAEQPDYESALDGIPLAMPALARAQTISRKAVRVGFEWPNLDGVLEKLAEEAREVEGADTQEQREAEIGDLLFVTVNLARWLGIDAESALRATNERFIQRFHLLERLARERDQELKDLDISALDQLWEEAKRLERQETLEEES